MDENVKEVRTHRVGSITLGSALVLFGILFLVHPVSYTHLTLPTKLEV